MRKLDVRGEARLARFGQSPPFRETARKCLSTAGLDSANLLQYLQSSSPAWLVAALAASRPSRGWREGEITMVLQIPQGPHRGRPRIVSVLVGVLVVQLALFLATPKALPLWDQVFQVRGRQPMDYLGYMLIEAILCMVTIVLLFLAGVGLLPGTRSKPAPKGEQVST